MNKLVREVEAKREKEKEKKRRMSCQSYIGPLTATCIVL